MDGSTEADDGHRKQIDRRFEGERDRPFGNRVDDGRWPARLAEPLAWHLADEAVLRELADQCADRASVEARQRDELRTGGRRVVMDVLEERREVVAPDGLEVGAGWVRRPQHVDCRFSPQMFVETCNKPRFCVNPWLRANQSAASPSI